MKEKKLENDREFLESIEDIINSETYKNLFAQGEQNHSIFNLVNVSAPKKKAHHRKRTLPVARLKTCDDFDNFEPLFERLHFDLSNNSIEMLPMRNVKIRQSNIQAGQFFVLKGIVCYVAAVQTYEVRYNRLDQRTRIVLENGRESEMLLSSFVRRLHDDKLSRHIINAKDNSSYIR